MDELSNYQLPQLPNKIYWKIFSFLDLPDVRIARQVSKIWKSIIPDARPNLRFVCQLTDHTFTFAVDSDENISCLDVHHFSGRGNEVMSATSGTGFLFGNIESIKFTGNNIEPGEIPKMMQFAVDSVKILEFKNCHIDTLRLFTQARQTFNDVQMLSISFTQFPKVKNTLALEAFATLELGPLLPSLERLHIFLDSPDFARSSCQDMFSSYLAVGALIMKHKRSLKDVEIRRTGMFRYIAHSAIVFTEGEHFEPSPAQTATFQQCLHAFRELALDKLYVSLENVDPPWTIDTQLLHLQQNLKQVVIDETVNYIRQIPDLTTMLPDNRSTLTSVKMTFRFHRTSGQVDLGAFRVCSSLKTLWLELFQAFSVNFSEPIWESSAQFNNVETLPKTVTNLRLKCDKDVKRRNDKHQLLLLSPEQINWIISNLRDLECLWVQLVLDPKRMGRRSVNRRPNMTLLTFRHLISMPRLKNLKLDMLKVSQLEASYHDREHVVEDATNEFDVPVIPFYEIQEYVDVCRYETHGTSVSRYPIQSRYFRFWELTIHTSN